MPARVGAVPADLQNPRADDLAPGAGVTRGDRLGGPGRVRVHDAQVSRVLAQPAEHRLERTLTVLFGDAHDRAVVDRAAYGEVADAGRVEQADECRAVGLARGQRSQPRLDVDVAVLVRERRRASTAEGRGPAVPFRATTAVAV